LLGCPIFIQIFANLWCKEIKEWISSMKKKNIEKNFFSRPSDFTHIMGVKDGETNIDLSEDMRS
jgi:hypothetical protein